MVVRRIVKKKHYLCATMTVVAAHKGSNSIRNTQNHHAVFLGLNVFWAVFQQFLNNQWTVKR